ncbi:MAG: KEOPS complex subunit Cgi121 [Candidatus Heimdallarchaeaceae archaeon]|jgi:tRNA threonylcarbamoyladenosine modification (KEOPS) complex Cgi121 subunit
MTKDGEDFYFRIFRKSASLDIDLLFDFLRERISTETVLQILDPTLLVSEKQLQSAIYHTEKSFENKRNIARTKGNELLIRLAGKRQISNALKLLGIKESSQYLLIIVFGAKLETNKKELDKLVEQFGIREEQLKNTIPISSLKVLSSYYECQEDLQEIEKRALEKIASVEVL